jgi:hypothetical protein
LVDKLDDNAPPLGLVSNKDDKIKLCNDIVSLYYEDLKTIINKFDSKILLEKLISLNETIIYKRAYYDLNTAPSVECYLDIASKVKNDIKDINETDIAALATRSLIEIVAAEPPKGNQKVSLAEIDNLLAIAYHIISWSTLSDQILYDLYEIDLEILKSGFVGRKINTENTWDPFILSKNLENLEANFDQFKYIYSDQLHENEDFEDKKINSAFKGEFGLDLNQIADFNGFLINTGFKQNLPVPSLLMSEFISSVKKDLGWNEKEIENAIKIFSLNKREHWEIPPKGYDNSDIWPWRYNRRLSYLRRPLIITSEPKNDPLILWGPRHVEDAEENLLNLVLNGKYKINDGTSNEMKNFVGNEVNKKGKEFTKKVRKWFENNTSFEIHSEVFIGPNKPLKSELNLGDIDVLVIDRDNNHIISIECKNIVYGRNPREIQNEIIKFIGEIEEDNSWVNKHLKRHKWLTKNKNEICSVYNLDSNSYEIFSIILTAKEIPSTHLIDLELPSISLTRLDREGLDSIYKLLNLNNFTN